MMFDKEIEAIAKCTELVKELDDDAKLRVIKYLIERFNVGPTQPASSKQIPGIQASPFQLPAANTESNEIQDIQIESDLDIPSLKDLLVKNYPKSEGEWMLCYAFYASKFGKDVFTREDLISCCKDVGKFEGNARSNFSANINACIKKDWIKSVNEDSYIMKPEGIDYARQILQGGSSTKERKIVKRKRKVESKVD